MTDVSVTLRPPCWCPSEGHQHGVSIQSSINLGETLFWIKREWITAEIWIVARLFRYQSSFISQLLDLIYWMVTIIIFNGVTLQPVLKRDFQDFYPRICLLYGNNVWYNSLNMLTLGYWYVKSNLWIFSLCLLSSQDQTDHQELFYMWEIPLCKTSPGFTVFDKQKENS